MNVNSFYTGEITFSVKLFNISYTLRTVPLNSSREYANANVIMSTMVGGYWDTI